MKPIDDVVLCSFLVLLQYIRSAWTHSIHVTEHTHQRQWRQLLCSACRCIFAVSNHGFYAFWQHRFFTVCYFPECWVTKILNEVYLHERKQEPTDKCRAGAKHIRFHDMITCRFIVSNVFTQTILCSQSKTSIAVSSWTNALTSGGCSNLFSTRIFHFAIVSEVKGLTHNYKSNRKLFPTSISHKVASIESIRTKENVFEKHNRGQNKN